MEEFIAKAFLYIFLSSLLSAGVVGFFAFIFREWIVAKLTYPIQNKYDTELARLNSELRKTESEVDSIRKASISSLTHSRELIFTKRIEALEELWKNYIEAKKYAYTVIFLAQLDVKRLSESKKKTEELFEISFKNIDQNTVLNLRARFLEAEFCRPWVGPEIWTLFSCYSLIVLQALSKILMIKSGIFEEKYFDKTFFGDTLKKAMPEVKKIDWQNLDPAVLPTVLEYLEIKMLQEFGLSISEDKHDKETIERTTKLTKMINEIVIPKT